MYLIIMNICLNVLPEILEARFPIQAIMIFQA